MKPNNLFNLAKRLFPIYRSITGDGVRKTLQILKSKNSELKVKNIKSGTKVFDWVVPNEWKIDEAYIITPDGRKICDIKKNNLHLISYSKSINKTLKYNQLKKKLYSLPRQPNAIPYITSYYKDDWGFCISENQKRQLNKKGDYKIVIKSKKFKGVLNYGEAYLKGRSNKEIFISTYICHPSLANNEISGPTVSSFILSFLKQKKRKYSYRLVFVPETIGSISYLSKNYNKLKKNVIAGFNLTCIGDERSYSYLPSRNGNTLSDKIAKISLNSIDPKFKKYSWYDRGSDERQYCAPGIDLPIASIMRTKYGKYKEYHTSLDRLGTVVTGKGLYGGYLAVKKAIEIIEKNKIPIAKLKCEPFMSKRNLYPTTSFRDNSKYIKSYMDILTYADGKHSLVDIAFKCNEDFFYILKLAIKLKKKKLITLKDS